MFVEQYGRAAARAERAAPAESSAEVLFEEPEQAIRRKVVEWLPTRSVQSGQDEMPGRAQRLVVAPSQQMGLEAFEFSAGEEQRLRSVQGAAAPSAGVPLDRLPQERSRALFLLRAAPTEK